MDSYNSTYKRCFGSIKNRYRDSYTRENRFFIENTRKKDVLENKFVRYSLLNSEVFIPLKYGIIKDNDVSYLNLHNFTFDISTVHKKPYFSEGMKHLNQDISQDFEDKFRELEEDVNRYNEDLENFETTGIYDLISNHFERYGFTVIRQAIIHPEHNISIIPESLQIFKSWWCEETPFEEIYDNNKLIIRHITISTFSDDNEIEIKKRIYELRYSNEILEKYQKLNNTFNEIKKTGKELSHKIEFKAISKINKREYTTICDECKDFINNS